MLNIGNKPTLNNSKHSLEVHIFDFSDDVYDSDIKVEFLKRIRDEKQFDSLEDLQGQLKIDENNCKIYGDHFLSKYYKKIMKFRLSSFI